MSENEKQTITDIKSMAPYVNAKVAESIKNLMEFEIEQEILKINPDADFDDMDINEKLMLLEYISKSEEERQEERKEAVPFDIILKEEGLSLDELRD